MQPSSLLRNPFLLICIFTCNRCECAGLKKSLGTLVSNFVYFCEVLFKENANWLPYFTLSDYAKLKLTRTLPGVVKKNASNSKEFSG